MHITNLVSCLSVLSVRTVRVFKRSLVLTELQTSPECYIHDRPSMLYVKSRPDQLKVNLNVSLMVQLLHTGVIPFQAFAPHLVDFTKFSDYILTVQSNTVIQQSALFSNNCVSLAQITMPIAFCCRHICSNRHMTIFPIPHH